MRETLNVQDQFIVASWQLRLLSNRVLGKGCKAKGRVGGRIWTRVRDKVRHESPV